MNPNLPAQAVVWIASYPKSGNTWVQTVIRHAGKPFGFPNGDLDVYRLIAEKREPTVVRGIRPRVSVVPTTVLKTHRAYRADGRLHPELRLRTAAFVYVMRNPLDMLLSYINFTRQQYGRRQDSAEYQRMLFVDLLGFDRPYSFDEWRTMKLETIPRRHLDHALERFTEAGTGIPGIAGTTRSTWIEHARSWLAAGETLPGVVLRYEDLLRGPEAFYPLRRIFTFTEAQIAEALESTNQVQRSMKDKAVFYNKMTSYYFRQFFSPELVTRFLDRYASELTEFGYGHLLEQPA